MGEKKMGSVLMICLVLGLLIGKSQQQQEAESRPNNFVGCYVPCFIKCMFSGSVFSCGVKCFAKCIFRPQSPTPLQQTQYYCTLGCATSMCANLSTKENPAGEKVGICVDSCSSTCTPKK